MRFTLLLCSACLLTACVTTNPQTAPNVRELMVERAEHIDKEVTARGYLQFSAGRRGLSQTPHLAVEEIDGVRTDCLTVWNYQHDEVGRLSRLDGKLVEVVGRFRFIPLKDDETNFWECNDYGIEISRLEALGG